MDTDAAMMAKVLPVNPDLETLDECYNSWHLKDWRKMERKSHGPIFQCGGSPWWVHEIS
jgi:ubiquitin carboxyl-terminal hydrolase 7